MSDAVISHELHAHIEGLRSFDVCVRQTHPRRRDTAATALPAASQSMYYSEAGCQL